MGGRIIRKRGVNNIGYCAEHNPAIGVHSGLLLLLEPLFSGLCSPAHYMDTSIAELYVQNIVPLEFISGLCLPAHNGHL